MLYPKHRMERAFGLGENSLTSYTKTYAELSAEASDVSLQTASEDNGVSLFADGELTVTVNQPEGGTVTVYNNSAFKTETADVPAGVTANSVVSANTYFTLTAPAEIVAKTDSAGKFADNSAVSVNYIHVLTATNILSF